MRFLPPDDERVRATVTAIGEELTDNGLVLRYRTDETDDGQSGEEGTFLICSFWLVSALCEIGDHLAAAACASDCWHTHHSWVCMPRSSKRPADVISATTRRRSRISR